LTSTFLNGEEDEKAPLTNSCPGAGDLARHDNTVFGIKMSFFMIDENIQLDFSLSMLIVAAYIRTVMRFIFT
jgi:hypothetical protein